MAASKPCLEQSPTLLKSHLYKQESGFVTAGKSDFYPLIVELDQSSCRMVTEPKLVVLEITYTLK